MKSVQGSKSHCIATAPHLTEPGGGGPHGLRPGHDGDGEVVGGRAGAGEQPPGGGAEVLAEEEVDEEVGGAVDAHQQVRRLYDELDGPVHLQGFAILIYHFIYVQSNPLNGSPDNGMDQSSVRLLVQGWNIKKRSVT